MRTPMKRLVSLSLVLLLTLALFAGCGKKEDEATGFTPGSYEGTARGFGGDIVATITLSETEIVSVEVVGASETAGIGDAALNTIPGEIVKNQSTDVDLVAGSTVTSEGIIAAVNAALTAAGIDPALLG